MKPIFKPPFDIIHRLASEARVIDNAGEGRRGAALTESECLLLLPGVDELRTYFYENTIENIPLALAG